MADLMKLFGGQMVYVDEDGFLSFNPKYEKQIGIVATTNIELDQDYMNVTSYGEQPQYIAGMQSYTVQYEIRLTVGTLNALDNYKEPKKMEVKKSIVEGPFAFLNIKED